MEPDQPDLKGAKSEYLFACVWIYRRQGQHQLAALIRTVCQEKLTNCIDR